MIMPMQAESLEVLEKADLPPAQARAIVRAIEIEIAGAKDTLATKHDVLLLRTELRSEMAELRGEMASLGSELRAEMAGLGTELRAEMTALRTELRSEMAELATQLRAEMAQLGANLRAELRAEIHATVGGVIRQMYTALLGQMAVLLGFAYFFATHVN
jgi:hypothetical protein